jgi:hypothetical protein
MPNAECRSSMLNDEMTNSPFGIVRHSPFAIRHSAFVIDRVAQ